MGSSNSYAYVRVPPVELLGRDAAHPPMPADSPLSVKMSPIAYAAVYGLGKALHG